MGEGFDLSGDAGVVADASQGGNPPGALALDGAQDAVGLLVPLGDDGEAGAEGVEGAAVRIRNAARLPGHAHHPSEIETGTVAARGQWSVQ